MAYNTEHGITPQTVKKNVEDVLAGLYKGDTDMSRVTATIDKPLHGANLEAVLDGLRLDMRKAAENLEFEEAARLRDEIKRLETVDLVISDDPLARQSAVEEAVEGAKKASGRSTGGRAGMRGWEAGGTGEVRRLKRIQEHQIAHQVDALRFALASASSAYHRVSAFCEMVDVPLTRPPDFRDSFTVLDDCWRIIDQAHRCDEILRSMGSSKFLVAERRRFRKGLSSVSKLRNLFHHFGSKSSQIPEDSPSIMGSLSWTSKSDPTVSLTMVPIQRGQQEQLPFLGV